MMMIITMMITNSVMIVIILMVMVLMMMVMCVGVSKQWKSLKIPVISMSYEGEGKSDFTYSATKL